MRKKHDQELEDIVGEILECKSPRAEAIVELVATGHLFPLNTRHVPGHKAPVKVNEDTKEVLMDVFPKDQWQLPLLTSDFLPWANLLGPHEVKEILREDIKAKELRFVPPLTNSEEKRAAAMQLVESIQTQEQTTLIHPLVWANRSKNPNLKSVAHRRMQSSIIHLSSPTFERQRSKTLAIDGAKGTLGQSPLQITVMPHEGILETVYHEHHTISALLTGKRLWIVFPARTANLKIINNAYKALREAKYSGDGETATKVWQDVIMPNQMEYGITFVQKAGETVVLPPFWSHLVMSIDTSVSAAFYVAKDINVPKRLEHMDMWLLSNSMWPSVELEQQHLVVYAKELLNHFSQVMKAETEDGVTKALGKKTSNAKSPSKKSEKSDSTKGAYKLTATQTWICENWYAVRESVAKLCASIHDQELARKLTLAFQEAWIEFLCYKAQERPKCFLCKLDVGLMPPHETCAVDPACLLRGLEFPAIFLIALRLKIGAIHTFW
ncbi:hypothetical protein N0V90_005935 [Kalmusia sp. IMI 367209]|nr:hypothetical protein N0V90_005935 [Kalmusia sp. IMI 367209]